MHEDVEGEEMRFRGRRAVVTGGMSGIGEAVTKRLQSEGCKVCIWDVNGGIKTDIADYGSVEAAVVETLEQIGGIDILVNCAGITGPTVPVNGFPLDGWAKTIAVNLNGTFFTNRAILPFMIEQNYGRIVNVASIAGKEGNPNASAYSASKAAVIGFTKSLAKETAQYNITANTVTPCQRGMLVLDGRGVRYFRWEGHVLAPCLVLTMRGGERAKVNKTLR
jgi:NAD(P)-dependent dehydrogenase (short-subunit alcohol dehydrogenase family)